MKRHTILWLTLALLLLVSCAGSPNPLDATTSATTQTSATATTSGKATSMTSGTTSATTTDVEIPGELITLRVMAHI